MAFTRVEKSNRSFGDISDPVITMGSYLADGKMHKSRSVAFRLSRALINQLGWQVVDDKLRIGVFEGTDKDVGFLQLASDPKGYIGTMRKDEGQRQGVSISVTIERFKHYVLNECPVPSYAVNHIVEGDALMIECPDWLRFNPQSVPQPEPPPPPKPETKVVDIHPGRGRRRQRA